MGAGTVVAATLAGCQSPSGQGQETDDEEPESRTIIVSDQGEVDGEPDLAILETAIEANADTAQAARDDLSRRGEQLRTALREYGIPDDNVTTERFRIHERIDRRRMEEDGVRPDSREDREEYIYYVGTHSFRVEIEDIESVGEVIDVAVDGGADEIDRVTYTLSDDKRADLRDQALRKALQNSRSEAETIADEIDAEVVEATVVDASEGRVSPVHREVRMDAGGVAATPTPAGAPRTGIEPGDVTVTANVDVRYKIE